MSLIEKAKDIIAMGENYEDAWAKYEEMTNPGDLLPLLRLLVECEAAIDELVAYGQQPHIQAALEALLDKLRSES